MPLVATKYEAQVEPALLPVDPKSGSVGYVLSMNTLRRAFARLAVEDTLAEPDWSSWSQELVAGGAMPVTHLLMPSRQTGCRLIQTAAPQQPLAVEHQYARAFFGEIRSNFEEYERQLRRNNVPVHILQALFVSVAHENLIREIELAFELLVHRRSDQADHHVTRVRRSA